MLAVDNSSWVRPRPHRAFHQLLLGAIVWAFSCGEQRPVSPEIQQSASPQVRQSISPEVHPPLRLPAGRTIDDELNGGFDSKLEVELLDTGRKKVLKNCRDFLALPLRGFDVPTEGDWSTIWKVGTRCIALDWANSMKPSVNSSFRNVDITPSFLYSFPPSLTLSQFSSDEIEQVKNAEIRCETWGEYEKKLTITQKTKDAFSVRGVGWGGEIQIFARGDFNSDGFEDILLRREGGPDGGSAYVYSLFIVTKTDTDKCLETIRRVW